MSVAVGSGWIEGEKRCQCFPFVVLNLTHTHTHTHMAAYRGTSAMAAAHVEDAAIFRAVIWSEAD